MRVLSFLLCSSRPQPVVEEIIILFNVCLSSNRCLFDLNVVFLTNINNYSSHSLTNNVFYILYVCSLCRQLQHYCLQSTWFELQIDSLRFFYVDMFFLHHHWRAYHSWERKSVIINRKYMEIDIVELFPQ